MGRREKSGDLRIRCSARTAAAAAGDVAEVVDAAEAAEVAGTGQTVAEVVDAVEAAVAAGIGQTVDEAADAAETALIGVAAALIVGSADAVEDTAAVLACDSSGVGGLACDGSLDSCSSVAGSAVTAGVGDEEPEAWSEGGQLSGVELATDTGD